MVALKKLKNLITELNEHIIIVEGKRDVIALKKIGVRVNILTFEKFMRKEIKNESNAVILTDFDEEGIIKEKIISSKLIERNIIKNDELRRKFKLIFGVITIEEVPLVFEKIIKGD